MALDRHWRCSHAVVGMAQLAGLEVKAWISGIAGFLGSNLAKQLKEADWEVAGCDNFLTSTRRTLPTGVKFTQADIRELTWIPDVDVVFHTAAIARSAWPDDSEIFGVNVGGTEKVMALAEKAGAQIVHCSSCVAAGPVKGAYANSKLISENLALSRGAVALRYSNIYGAGQSEIGPEPNVLASWRTQAREHGQVRVDGDGSQTRDFIHVSDAARATAMAIGAQGWFDICTGVQTPIIDVAKMFGVEVVYAARRDGDPDSIPQDPEPSFESFGFRATVSLQDGLREVLS